MQKQASERPQSLDKDGGKLRIIPAEVKGYFRRRRDFVQAILVIFFLVLPWTKINGKQSLLIDVLNRKFIFFGVQFMSHDTPLVFFILAILALSLALVTALWGRAWCGWACPQTVFIDGVFRRIEILIEGKYIERRRLHQSEMSLSKLFKVMTKWFLFSLVSMILAHSLIAYFAGAENLLHMMQGKPTENWGYFVLVFSTTLILLFNFGWFREQFCLVMCPYGRFQSVLLDADSKTVIYDKKRNDCVSCNRCVQVCPTGIDIRHGLQMECIACTACIDACDEIMVKVKKPMGLIRYDSESGRRRLLRPRTLIYGVVLSGLVGLLGFNFTHREAFIATVLRGKDVPYQIVKNETGTKVINHLRLHLLNQLSVEQNFKIVLSEQDLEKGIQLVMSQTEIQLLPWKNQELHLFVEAPLEIFKGSPNFVIEIIIQSQEAEEMLMKKASLAGPQNESDSL